MDWFVQSMGWVALTIVVVSEPHMVIMVRGSGREVYSNILGMQAYFKFPPYNIIFGFLCGNAVAGPM